MRNLNLSLRQRLSFLVHLWKAVARQHHSELAPLLRVLIPNDGVVFDIGTHSGQFSKLFSKIVPHGHVYSFEPGAYPFAISSRVLNRPAFSNVTLHATALSDCEGEEKLYTPIKSSGSLGFGLAHIGSANESRETRCETIRLTTLDKFVSENAITRIDFIKADIEGHEGAMLRGAQNALAHFQPSLMLELTDTMLARTGDTRPAIISALESMGYQTYGLTGNKLTRAKVASCNDLVFIHTAKSGAFDLTTHLLG